MAAVVIVGPSKAGKTTLARAASGLAGVTHYVDLDQVADVHTQGWQERGFEILRRLGDCGSLSVIDVGASFQHDRRGRGQLVEHRDRMIVVMAPPDIVYARHPGRGRDEFMETEYGQARMLIYEMARFKLNISDDIEADQRRLAGFISEALVSAQ